MLPAIWTGPQALTPAWILRPRRERTLPGFVARSTTHQRRHPAGSVIVKIDLIVTGDTPDDVISVLRLLALGKASAERPARADREAAAPATDPQPITTVQAAPATVPAGHWADNHVTAFWRFLTDDVRDIYRLVAHTNRHTIAHDSLLDAVEIIAGPRTLRPTVLNRATPYDASASITTPACPTPCPSTTSPTPTGCDPTSPMPSSGSISELRRTDGRRLCPHPGLVEEAERQTSCFGVPKLGDCDQPVQLAPHAVIGRHDAVDPSGFRSVHNATLAAFLENRKAMVLSPLWLKTPQSCGSDARHSASPLC